MEWGVSHQCLTSGALPIATSQPLSAPHSIAPAKHAMMHTHLADVDDAGHAHSALGRAEHHLLLVALQLDLRLGLQHVQAVVALRPVPNANEPIGAVGRGGQVRARQLAPAQGGNNKEPHNTH
jgi:hypothetical protein